MSWQGTRRWVLMLSRRGTDMFGYVGWLGVALCAVALAWLGYAWQLHQSLGNTMPASESATATPTIDPVAPGPLVPAPSITLARPDEQALLLTQIQQVAVTQGLMWTAADYKTMPATDGAPATLEVRCTLKGSYPRLRAVLTQWLRQMPSLVIRDVAMSRSSSDIAEVEAKLQLAIFLSDRAEPRP